MGRYVSAIREGLDADRCFGSAHDHAVLRRRDELRGRRRPPGARARVRARRGRRGGAAQSRAASASTNAIAFDMGGTTAKASLIEDGAVSRAREYEAGGSLSTGSRLMRGAGELLRIPTIDIAEVVPAAARSPGSTRRAASRSARAAPEPRPGPACYGRGGSEPTVTDANVFLGYIPSRPARLRRPLDHGRRCAEKAVARIAAPLELSAHRGRRGHPRDRQRPHDARAALGLLREGPRPARVRADRLRRLGPGARRRRSRRSSAARPCSSRRSPGSSLARPALRAARVPRRRIPATLDARTVAPAQLGVGSKSYAPARAVARGAEAEWVKTAELRYGGQSWEVEVELPRRPGGRGARRRSCGAVRGRARAPVRRPRRAGAPIEIRALRLAGLGRSAPSRARRSSEAGRPAHRHRGRPSSRRAPGGADAHAAPRSASAPSQGRSSIDEYDTTVVVRPGWSVRRSLATETLIMERTEAGSRG